MSGPFLARHAEQHHFCRGQDDKRNYEKNQAKRELVEFGETDQIFMNPVKKETQDYITGRFG